MAYLRKNNLRIDWHGMVPPYDLVVECADLIIPHDIPGTPIILVQEGMTDPEGLS